MNRTANKPESYRVILSRIFKLLYNHFGPQQWWPGDTPFEVMVGAILTQNTNWINVEKAIYNLKSKGVLDVKKIARCPESLLAELIRPAGYYNVKTKRLKNFVEYFIQQYDGKIEQMKIVGTERLREELLKIKGVGHETADSILLYALEKPVFVVDAYTKRVLTRHRIIADGKLTYDEVQKIFHDNLPEDVQLFNEYHALFVRLGKEYCRPKPLCEGCPLSGMLK